MIIHSPTESSWRGILLGHYCQDLHHWTQEPALLCPDHDDHKDHDQDQDHDDSHETDNVDDHDYNFDVNHHCCRPAVVVDYDLFCPFLPDFAFKSL